MAVMNGFRKELLDKILGLNGHLLVQPLESPLTDWKDVADRINAVAGIRLAAPVVDGQALASSPFNASGVLVRGIRAADLDNITSIAKNIKQGTLEGFDDGQGVAIGRRLADQLSIHGVERERRAESALIDLAYAKGLPLVATNEPYFAAADDYEAHDALLCIAGGRLIAETERDQLTPDHRFKTRAEMAVLFADLPEALASTVEIAARCAYRPRTRKPILPHFTVGADTNGADAEVAEAAELRRQAEEGLAHRMRPTRVAGWPS